MDIEFKDAHTIKKILSAVSVKYSVYSRPCAPPQVQRVFTDTVKLGQFGCGMCALWCL